MSVSEEAGEYTGNMNTRTKFLLAALLFLLPFVVLWAWFNRPQGRYAPPESPNLEGISVTLPETAFQPIADRPQPGNGRVIADLTHNNNLETDDLTPLGERLAARGVELVFLDDFTLLESTLRGATAFVVAAPTFSFDSYERGVIEDFVKDGGKLLIIADPTRQVPIPEEDLFYSPFAVFFPESAVPVVNSLSYVFGLIYFDDYLYNLESGEGNYRNVRYAELDQGSPLTDGVDDLVLFAAHSIRGGKPLFTGDKNVLSDKRTGETGLAPAMISEDGNVVALGDLTLFTAPYHTVAGNDQFLSNLADWLVEDGRAWDLADFPYLFDGMVEYVQLKDADFDPRLLVFGSTLQGSFAEAGIDLIPSEVLSPTQDALLAGTYLEHESVADLLHSAGVTVTLTFSETEGGEAPTIDQLQEGKLDIAGLGTLDINGTTLYLEHPVGEDEVAVLVLAYDESALVTALENLIFGFPSGCLKHGPVTLCSTAEASGGPDDNLGTPPTPEGGGTLPPTNAARIFLLALDNGPEGSLTSSFELELYLGPYYNLTVWSVFLDGIPTSEDVVGYDLYLIDSGDYAFDEESFTIVQTMLLNEIPTWLLGSQPLFAFETEPLVDIEVVDAAHPIVAGIAESLITLSESLSGVPEQLLRLENFDTSGGASVILARGPGSTTPGAVVLFAFDDGITARAVIATLPLYRLPFDVQETLALNIVGWLLGDL